MSFDQPLSPLATTTRCAIALSVALAAGFASQAKAEIWRFEANLDGLQTIPQPAPTSTGTGFIQMDIDTETFVFDITIELENMEGAYDPFFLVAGSGNLSGAHLHVGQAGTASMMHAYDTLPNLWTNESGNQDVMPGDWSYSATGQTLFPNRTLDEIFSPGVYLNVHSAALDAPENRFNTGELRGQLQFVGVVPEPASMALMLAGTALIGSRRRR